MRAAFPPLYAVADAALLGSADLSFMETIAESGVVLLQYRNKLATSRQLFDACRSFSARLQPFALRLPEGLRFLVNDRPDIALLAGTGGVHVGQDDLGVEEARAIVGRERWVGVSTHTLPQVEAADKTSADYVAFGPVFPTVTKANPDPVVGLELLSQARALTRKPLVAIGGITLDRAAETYRAGADSLAVARDLIAVADPSARVRAFLDVATAVAGTARP